MLCMNWKTAATVTDPYLGEVLFPRRQKAGLDLNISQEKQKKIHFDFERLKNSLKLDKSLCLLSFAFIVFMFPLSFLKFCILDFFSFLKCIKSFSYRFNAD